MKKFVVVFFLLVWVWNRAFAQTWPTDTIRTFINSGNPKFPFPQFLEYQEGKTVAKHLPIGVSHAEMERTIRDAYRIMMNRALYTKEEVGGVKYIAYNHPNIPRGTFAPFVTEGDGYALIAASFMGDKATFDGLWMWCHDYRLTKVKRYNDCLENFSSYQYGKNSEVWVTGTSETGEDRATDGTVDYAMGLLMAYRQWPEGSITTKCGTTVTYKEELFNFINSMVGPQLYTAHNSDVYKDRLFLHGVVGLDGYQKDGNKWGETTSWTNGKTFGDITSLLGLASTDVDAPSNGLSVHTVGYLGNPGTASFFDYHASGYWREFGDFLQEIYDENNPSFKTTKFNIAQCKRAEASTDWLLGKLVDQGSIISSGNVSVNNDGTTLSFAGSKTSESGENFRLPMRNLVNYLWHGNPSYIWDPVSHLVGSGTSTSSYRAGKRMSEFLRTPSNNCEDLGMDPTGSKLQYSGVTVLRQEYFLDGSPQNDYYTNYTLGASAGSSVIDEDTNLAAKVYRQLEIEWDVENQSPQNDFERYTGSLEKYFHGYNRLYGLLVLTGNYHAPNSIKSPKANVKCYLDIDKTYGFRNDVVTYTISYRNYASVEAKDVQLEFDLPDNFIFVSAEGGGVFAGGKVVWNLTSVPGFKTGQLASTMGSFKVVAKVATDQGTYCPIVTVSASNGTGWTSSKFPNTVSATLKKTCFDVVKRALEITKISDVEQVNPSMPVNFDVKFKNNSDAGWINGGRPGVRFTFANAFADPPANARALTLYARILHAADEAYINYGNYRLSYYLNSPVNGIAAVVNKGLNGGNCDNSTDGWCIKADIEEGGATKVTFQEIILPLGYPNADKVNQRLVFGSSDTLAAPVAHLYNQTGNLFRIHRGTTFPYKKKLIISNNKNSANQDYTDDWSYSAATIISETDDKEIFFPVTPDWSNGDGTQIAVKEWHTEECRTTNKTFDKVLVEEFDGYGWRRVFGTGPFPGREANDVVVLDTVPTEFDFVKFTQMPSIGTVTYNASTRIIRWTAPSFLPGQETGFSYQVTAKAEATLGGCPINKNVSNKAWISTASESPKSGEAIVNITCQTITPKPQKTTMTKKADKTNYKEQDDIIYTIEYTQTTGTRIVPDLKTNTKWTSRNGNPLPTFDPAGFIKFADVPQPGDNNKNFFITYDYSHGKNGILKSSEFIDNTWNNFSYIFRYNPVTSNDQPGSVGFVGLAFNVWPDKQGTGVEVSLYNGSTEILPFYGSKSNNPNKTPGTQLDFVFRLQNDTLIVWIDKDELQSPSVMYKGIPLLSPGYVGYYNQKIGTGGGGGPTKNNLLTWDSHFDSAFDLQISDPIPNGITYQSASGSGAPNNSNTILWPLQPGPVLYGSSFKYTWIGKVASCEASGKIVNNAYVNLIGQGTNTIGAQSVTTCGTPPTCTPPTSLTAKAPFVTVCENQPATFGATFTLGTPTNAYHYTWRKKGVTGNPIKDSVEYRDLSINQVSPADTGTYILRINDGTDDVATCYKEVEIHLTLSPKPTATITTPIADLAYCKGTNGVTLTATPVPNATYQWLKRGVVKGTNTNTLANADSGKYIVVVSFGTCADTSNEVTVSLSEHGAVSISGDTILCPADVLTLTATPANVIWTLPDKIQSTINPLSLAAPKSGVYKASLSSGVCAGADSVTVMVENPATPPKVNLKADKPGYCEGDTAVFTAESEQAVAPSFKWYVNGLVQADTTKKFSTSKLNPDVVIKVVVTSHGTCSGEQTVFDTLTPLVQKSVNVSLKQKVVSEKVCVGQEVTFEIATAFPAGTLFDWYNNDKKASTALSYEVPINSATKVYASVTSPLACAKPAIAYSDTVVVDTMSNIAPLVEITSDKKVMCSNDKSVAFSISRIVGGDVDNEYQWLVDGNPIPNETNDSLKINTLSDGQKVSLLFTSHLACRTKDTDVSNEIALSIQLSKTPSITIDTAVGGLGCEGDSVIFTATHSAGTVLWSNSATGDQLVLPGWSNGTRITATLTSSETCATSPEVTSNAITLNGTVRMPFTLDWSLSPDQTTPLCPGDIVLSPVTTTKGLTYTWTVGNDVKVGATYTVTNATKDIAGLVEASIEGCYVDAVNNRLTFSKPFVYSVSKPVQVSFDQTELGTCKEKPALVSVNSSGNIAEFEWYVQNTKVITTSTDTTTLTGLKDGDVVKVVAVPATSCPVDPASLTAEVTVRVSERPMAGFVNRSGAIYICSGDKVELLANETNSSYVYTWLKDGKAIDNQFTNRLNATSAGNYALVIRNGYCNETSKITIQDNAVTVKAIADPVEFVPGDAVKVSAIVDPDKPVTYAWSPAQLLIPSDAQGLTFYPQETMYVKIKVITVDGGCVATDSVQIRKIDRLFIPNAITPETGDQNASWDIKGTEAFPDLDVRVYNRWGSLVHEQRGYGKPWDGTLNGKPLPTGTYYYVLKHSKLDGPKVGDLTIVR